MLFHEAPAPLPGGSELLDTDASFLRNLRRFYAELCDRHRHPVMTHVIHPLHKLRLHCRGESATESALPSAVLGGCPSVRRCSLDPGSAFDTLVHHLALAALWCFVVAAEEANHRVTHRTTLLQVLNYLGVKIVRVCAAHVSTSVSLVRRRKGVQCASA